MQTPPLSAGLLARPDLYPFMVNWLTDSVQFVRVDQSFYERAPFLDQRAVAGAQLQRLPVQINEVKAATTGAQSKPMGLIFHIGHCGSTLISRLLGLARDDFFSLREPLPLRDVATMWTERNTAWAIRSEQALLEDMDMLHALWARTFGDGQMPVVKATSFCSLLSADWLSRFSEDRALLLAMAPEIYLATVLGGESYVTDLIGGAKPRLCALSEATGADIAPLHSMAPGEVAAVCYLAEMVNMERAAKAAPERIMRLDFDAYLKNPADRLLDVSTHFGRTLDGTTLTRVISDPVATRYSKATEYGFTAGERRDRLAQSRTKNAAEIQKGLAFLTRFAKAQPLAKDALINFGYAK